MRLTLRTLLAYLDNILEPADREILAEKIETSEFAQELIQRMRTVLNNTDLTAPEPVGRGLGRDPNSVAEYLDNAMAREQLEEFERLCLDQGSEADIQLAEVTSCHHVLTMVLSEPVQFETATRERMYRLSNVDIEQTVSIEEGVAVVADDAPDPETEPATPEIANVPVGSIQNPPLGEGESKDVADALYDSKVPDYLRDQSRPNRFVAMVVTALVAALVTGVILTMFDTQDPVLSKTEVSGPRENGQHPSAVEVPVQQTEVDAQDSGGKNAELAAANIEPGSKAIELTPPAAKPPAPAGENLGAAAGTDERLTATPGPDPASRVTPAPGKADEAEADAPPEKSPPGPVSTPDNPLRQSSESSDKPPSPETEEEDDVPREATVMGRLLSHDQILLSTPDDFDGLRRVPAQSTLKSGQKLIILPAFRPQISLVATTIDFDGRTMIELLNIDENDAPEFKVYYGRLVVRASVPNTNVRLRVADQRLIELALGDINSAVGLEVYPKIAPGSDPEEPPTEFVVNLFALDGSVGWQSDALSGVIESGQHFSFSSNPPSPDESPPSRPLWLTKTEITDLDRRAIPTVEQTIRPERTVRLSLIELTETNPRFEIKQLAMRCCAHIGYFDPLIKAVNDKDQARRWDNYADELNEAVTRSPQTARRVLETLQRLRGEEEGFELYRLLWGYSDNGLQNNGEADQLVNFLDHEDLDFRVLSHWNLKKITGLGSTYRPEHTGTKRKKSASRWQKRLEDGEIKYKIGVLPTKK